MTIDIAVLFSGGGRTVLNLLNHIEAGNLDARITLAIASKDGLVGIDRLNERGLDIAIARTDDEPLEIGDSRTSAWLEDARPSLICLCGYLRLLTIEPWMEGRVLNIHPALLPNHGGKGMYGMRVHEHVIKSGDTQSGCTVHFVDEQSSSAHAKSKLMTPLNHSLIKCFSSNAVHMLKRFTKLLANSRYDG